MKARLLVPMFYLLIFAVLIESAVPAIRARASTVTVSDCSAPSGAPGRLVEVIAAAAADDSVDFSCSGTITLLATITIDKNLSIDGTGQSVTISGGNTVRVFTVNAGVTFSLANLTVANGLASVSHGGGVYNDGALTVTNVTFSGNSVSLNGYGGGGIYSMGTLDVTNSAFSGNSASYGGAIFSTGTSNVTDSTFSGNSATISSGGGIYAFIGTLNVSDSTFSGNSAVAGGGIINAMTSTLNVTNSTFSGNSASYYGGGIYNMGIATSSNSTFSGNVAANNGSGIFNMGTLNVTDSTISGNWTPGSGAGISNLNATVNVTNSDFSANTAATDGGGIYSTGTLTVTNSAFSGNGAGAGGGIHGTGTSIVANSTFSNNSAHYGGGIYTPSTGTLNVTNSTFSGNSVYRDGGGIHNSGTLNVTNSTFFANSAPGLTGDGGGIYNSTGTVTVTNSTFSGNSAGSAGGGIRGPATLKNTIVANSTSSANCSGVITDGGGNLQFGGNVANSCGASIPTSDPMLNALADNGGPTLTMALSVGSAALGAANYATCMAPVGAPNYGAGGLDQRGLSRSSAGSVCDIGAFEGLVTPPALTVTDCSAPSGAAGRLVEVVSAAGNGDTVFFSCSGTITLATTITIDKNLAIDGQGQSVTISGGDAVRVFMVNLGKTFNLQNLTVANGLTNSGGGGVNNSGTLNVTNVTFSGNTTSGGSGGGGIYNGSTGTSNVSNSTFSGNSGGWRGGGIGNAGGMLNVTNSTFSGNSSGLGGGIANHPYGSLTVTNSSFSGNSSGYGGGISSERATSTVTNNTFSGNTASYGGGVYFWDAATVTVMNSTFSGNTATDGGGIYGAGTLMVTNSTFSGNTATSRGGGIYGAGTLTVTNSTFSGNSGDGISGSPFTVKNNIMANNTPLNCRNATTDGGGNLQFGGAVADSCGVTIPISDPKLSALADNGGPTQTMALLPDSPAINAANPANCPATDQRGVERGSSCDIGAYEYLGVATGTVTPTSGGTIALADGTFTITFPPDAVTTTVTITHTQALAPTQPLPLGRIGLSFFTLEARDGVGNLVTNFNQPYTLTLTYTDAELAALGITEALNVSFWNGTAWVDMLPCAGCYVNTVNNRVTIVANHFSDFAWFGQNFRIFLPLVIR